MERHPGTPQPQRLTMDPQGDGVRAERAAQQRGAHVRRFLSLGMQRCLQHRSEFVVDIDSQMDLVAGLCDRGAVRHRHR